jgi:hypothetical protein
VQHFRLSSDPGSAAPRRGGGSGSISSQRTPVDVAFYDVGLRPRNRVAADLGDAHLDVAVVNAGEAR